MKKLISLLLLVAFLFALAPASFAADAAANAAAERLNELGLFNGVGKNTDGTPIYDLDRVPTREEAITMLVRLLGKEESALQGTWETPFSDVSLWARPYVGYAYANGLAAGISSTTYGGDVSVSATQYITFVLRALGYSDKSGDFAWDSAWTLSDRIGLTNGEYNAMTSGSFSRGDVAIISSRALDCLIVDSEQTLLQRVQGNAISGGKTLSATEISQKCSPSVFTVSAFYNNGTMRGTGSGFFISSDGYAITNFHVIANSTDIFAETTDGITHNVSLVDADQANDLALLKVEGAEFPYLEIGNSTNLEQGQTVFAIGSPKGLANTMSTGIISNPLRIVDGEEFIQISVPITHGSSGGALIDERGKVIGVTSAGFESGDLNLAIAIEKIKSLDKEKDDLFFAFDHTCYPSFEYVIDFGEFSGVNIVKGTSTPVGYTIAYDMDDFKSIFGRDTSLRYAETLVYYGQELEKCGLKKLETFDNGTLYGNGAECVLVELDYAARTITVYAGHVVTFYTEFPSLPDLGWYLGLECSEEYYINGSKCYNYRWTQFYSNSSIQEGLYNYALLLSYAGFSYKYADSAAILYEGKGLSIVVQITGNFVNVDVRYL